MVETVVSVLLRELCVLAGKARSANIPVIIGGGVGLLLRHQQVRENPVPTLRAYPEVRATTDLDVFLTAEIISDSSKMETLRHILDDLGFRPVQSALFYQFSKPMHTGSPLPEVKLDLLAPLPDTKNITVGDRRIRPRGYKKLHAHVTPEAMTIEEFLTPVALSCGGSEVSVYVPHPFSYLLLKLFAFRDRRDDPNKLYGRYHAFDIYTSLAMMTEEQFLEGIDIRKRYSGRGELKEAEEIAGTFFGTPNDLGILRIREHMRQVQIRDEEVDLDGFLQDLRDLLE